MPKWTRDGVLSWDLLKHPEMFLVVITRVVVLLMSGG